MQIEYQDPVAGVYQAGVCNIGSREIARRRAFGIAGLIGTAALAIALVAIDAPAVARALVIVPLWGSLISLEQARRRFCAAFAYAGIRSVAGSDATESVLDPADLARDHAAARWLVARCGVVAAVVTAAFVLVPL